MIMKIQNDSCKVHTSGLGQRVDDTEMFKVYRYTKKNSIFLSFLYAGARLGGGGVVRPPRAAKSKGAAK
jgi:hypothetical protein